MLRVLRKVFLMGLISAVAVLVGRIVYDLVDNEKVWHQVPDFYSSGSSGTSEE